MVIRRPVAGEAAHLVADLLDNDPVRTEAATARLLVLGPRAVAHVLDALPGAPAADAVRLLGVLALLPATRRAVRPLDAAATRDEAAAEAVTSVWVSWLAAEDRELSTLAFDRLAAVALDDTAPHGARRLAVRAIEDSGGDAAATLIARLPDDVRARAGSDAGSPPAADAGRFADSPAGVRDYVASQGGTAPLPDLHRALERTRARQQGATDPSQAADWLAARGALHQALAARGSTVALYDLRELFERLDGPPPIGAVAAMREVGDAECLDAVASAWARVADEWTRDQLRGVTAAICERHRITGRHAAFKRLAAKAPALAEATPARRTRTSG